MKIIVDNGGTKSDWIVVHQNRHFSNVGINLFENELSIIEQFNSIIPKDLINHHELNIDFYSAGMTMNNYKKLKKIFTNQFTNIRINFFSDLLAASRALFKNEKGITCILGTGSNCAYYDGQENHSFFMSSGHIFSDEGGGYDLGKRLLQSYFRNELSDDLEQQIYSKTGFDKEDLISHIYSLTNHKPFISSMSKILKKNHFNPQIHEIITKSLVDFLNKYPFQFSNYKDLKFGFVGGVAYNFKNQLNDIMVVNNIDYSVIEKPIFHLLNYYQ